MRNDESEGLKEEEGMAMGSEEGDRVAVLSSVSERVVDTDMDEGRVSRFPGREGEQVSRAQRAATSAVLTLQTTPAHPCDTRYISASDRAPAYSSTAEALGARSDARVVAVCAARGELGAVEM